MSGPLVSFVIPAYNHERYIEETIYSAIAQTYRNTELLIIDDGSTDNTWEKISALRSECEQRFVRTQLLRRGNRGSSQTLQELYTAAKGDFVCTCASDDRFKAPDAVERMVDFLVRHHDYGLAVGDNEIIDEEGRVCYWNTDRTLCYNKNLATYRTFADFLKTCGPFDNSSFGTYYSLYKGNYIPNGYLIRRSILEKTAPLTEETALEDWFVMLQLSKFSKFHYFDEVFFSYRWHNANTVKNVARLRAMKNRTRAYEENVLQSTVQNPPLPLRPDVAEVAAHGIRLSRHGIPGLCELQTYRKGQTRLRTLVLLSQPCLTWAKHPGHQG